jgi:opacity protein-like surface antigen
MKRLFLAVASVLALTSVAVAADLNKKKPAPAPVYTPYAAVAPTPWYVGARGGYVTGEDWSGGVNAGYEFNRYFRAEVGYDYLNNPDSFKTKNSHVAAGNLIGQYSFGPFTPYAYAGAGYRWSDNKDEPVWNAGVGARYALTKQWELDGRYRYIANYDNKASSNVFTLGVNFKF